MQAGPVEPFSAIIARYEDLRAQMPSRAQRRYLFEGQDIHRDATPDQLGMVRRGSWACLVGGGEAKKEN